MEKLDVKKQTDSGGRNVRTILLTYSISYALLHCADWSRWHNVSGVPEVRYRDAGTGGESTLYTFRYPTYKVNVRSPPTEVHPLLSLSGGLYLCPPQTPRTLSDPVVGPKRPPSLSSPRRRFDLPVRVDPKHRPPGSHTPVVRRSPFNTTPVSRDH